DVGGSSHFGRQSSKRWAEAADEWQPALSSSYLWREKNEKDQEDGCESEQSRWVSCHGLADMVRLICQNLPTLRRIPSSPLLNRGDRIRIKAKVGFLVDISW